MQKERSFFTNTDAEQSLYQDNFRRIASIKNSVNSLDLKDKNVNDQIKKVFLETNKDALQYKDINNKEKVVAEVKPVIEVKKSSFKPLTMLNNSIHKDSMKTKTDIILCPKCKTYIEFTGGCSFITCQTPFCNGNYHFCFVCKKILTSSEKGTHFKYGLSSRTRCANKE